MCDKDGGVEFINVSSKGKPDPVDQIADLVERTPEIISKIKTVKTPGAKQIDVVADFCSEESEIDIKICFGLRVWHVFHVAFAALGELIKYFFKSMKHKREKK